MQKWTAWLAALALVLSLFALYISLANSRGNATTYEECVLSNLDKMQTEQAARILTITCQKKFPAPAATAAPTDPFVLPSAR